MLTLHQATIGHLSALLELPERAEIDGLLLPKGEEIAPRFWIEFIHDRLKLDPENSFWWSIRSIVVNRSSVGAIGFKSPPDNNGSVEIGYGIVLS